MTITSIAKRIGVATAALRVVAKRIVGRVDDRGPVISLAIDGDKWVVENHGKSVAYDVQIEPIAVSGLTATFPSIPILSSFHSIKLSPLIVPDHGSYRMPMGPLSAQRHDIREILLMRWNEANHNVEIPPSIIKTAVWVKYHDSYGWRTVVAAELILNIMSRELSVRNIRTNDQPEYREA